MKVYFTASLRGKKRYGKNYEAIVRTLKEFECDVISDHVLKESYEKVETLSDDYRVDYYKRMLTWISSSDVVVAEVTESSTSIGHEVTLCLEKGKPVIGLCEEGNVPTIFKALKEDKFMIITYSNLENDLRLKLRKALKRAQKSIDIRFNFFISPQISQYLDWVAKKKRLPRSVYLRKLIEEDMSKQTDYSEQKKE